MMTMVPWKPTQRCMCPAARAWTSTEEGKKGVIIGAALHLRFASCIQGRLCLLLPRADLWRVLLKELYRADKLTAFQSELPRGDKPTVLQTELTT
eukprot:1140240-Pelagomonas_calceolata.AAC.2